MVGMREPCPCGSGKRYKNCCHATERSRGQRSALIWVAAGAALVAVALVVFAQRNRTPGPTATLPTAAAPGTPSPETAANQSPLPDGRTPAAFEFDSLGNRYWDPTHGHWHNGRPPVSTNPTGSITPNVSAQSPVAAQSNPSIPNPQPWQYDPASDTHYDPGHGHWHQGRPPANPGSSTPPIGLGTPPLPNASTTTRSPVTVTPNQRTANPNVTNPTPWQYDASVNKHYDPGHGHWHDGPPPPADQR